MSCCLDKRKSYPFYFQWKSVKNRPISETSTGNSKSFILISGSLSEPLFVMKSLACFLLFLLFSFFLLPVPLFVFHPTFRFEFLCVNVTVSVTCVSMCVNVRKRVKQKRIYVQSLSVSSSSSAADSLLSAIEILECFTKHLYNKRDKCFQIKLPLEA